MARKLVIVLGLFSVTAHALWLSSGLGATFFLFRLWHVHLLIALSLVSAVVGMYTLGCFRGYCTFLSRLLLILLSPRTLTAFPRLLHVHFTSACALNDVLGLFSAIAHALGLSSELGASLFSFFGYCVHFLLIALSLVSALIALSLSLVSDYGMCTLGCFRSYDMCTCC